jgi:hypothetical protein
MSIVSLTNVPSKDSNMEIRGHVEGENIYIIAAVKGSKWRDGHSVSMTTDFIGDHMMQKPHDLRQMYADSLAAAIRLGREAGYAQAQADIRAALGVPRL